MAKKKSDASPEPPAEVTPPASDSEPGGNGEAHRPAVSWALQSDRTTRIEIACWVNQYVNQQGEEYEQVSFTVSRNYRNEEGWQRGGSWRTHDIPILLFLLNRAHSWALARRTSDSSIPF